MTLLSRSFESQTEEPLGLVLRPSLPPPTASSADVRAFLVQYFLALECERSREDAHKMALKIHADGRALYELPEKRWTDEFGSEGQTIYHALQTSEYGYVSLWSKFLINKIIFILIQVQDGGYWPVLKLVGAAIFVLDFISGASQLWTAKDARSYTIPIIFTSIVTGLIIFNLLCKSQPIVDSTRFPERLKIRKPAAQPGPWGLWTSTT